MSRPTTNNPVKWTSKGRTISKSLCHKEMYIIDDGAGKFHFINTGEEVALKMWPPDKNLKAYDFIHKYGIRMMITSNEIIPVLPGEATKSIQEIKKFINIKSL